MPTIKDDSFRYFNPRTQQISKEPSKYLSQQEIVYSSYAGTDIAAEVIVPGEGPIVLGELQTISYSIHRENSPVRFIGHVNPMGFVKGPRTIAGSLIFTVFNDYAFYRVKRYQAMVEMSGQTIFPLADMLPPFDVVLSFANEFGSFSKMKILGVSIVDEGGTMSIDDLITEQTYTYMARGFQPMTRYLPSGMRGDLSLSSPNRNNLRFG